MKNLNTLVSRFHNGDSLNDDELIALREGYKKAAEACAPLGDEYLLAFRDANSNYIRIRDICDARAI